MTATRPLRPASPFHPDHQGRRLLAAYLVSLVLHLLLFVGVTGNWYNSPSPEKQPVYYVDLVHKPVLNPQAGRPEPRVAAPAPKPAAPAPAPKTTLPEKTVLPAKAAPKPAGKTAPTKAAEQHVASALQKLRDEQTLQQRMAALRQAQAIPADIPVGMPEGKGTEAGVSSLVYVQATIQQNWALSPYTLADPSKMARIEAWVRVSYAKSGRLESFRFEKESGDAQFDESIKRALLKSQQLEQPLPARLEDVRVIFNLKELKALTEARR